MGRRKISITKLEPRHLRTITFNKRSLGIKKKVKGISVLSDSKAMLLIRTPSGEYDLALGEHNTFDGIIQQFLSESQGNRNKSWKRSMEDLDKAFRADEHSYKALMDLGTLSKKEKQGSQMEELKSVKEKISEIESRLGLLRNINEIDKMDSVDELAATKKLILDLLVKNEREKEMFIARQRSGVQNFTNPYTRVNSGYSGSASMGIPVITAEASDLNEREVQEKISEFEKVITAVPSGFNESDVQEQISELEKLIAADQPSGFSDRDVIDQMSELEKAIRTGFFDFLMS